MKKINKGNPPAFFSDFLRKENPTVWDEASPIRTRLRKYILDNEQKGCCAYTGIRITKDENCHIDHFRTRNLFPEKTFDYNNMLVSCNSEDYGAKYKDKQMKDKADYGVLINPVEDNPSDYMEYTFTGEMQAIDQNERGCRTIGCLNLNERRLVNRRKNAIHCLLNMQDDLNEDEIVEAIGEFEPMIRQLYKQN